MISNHVKDYLMSNWDSFEIEYKGKNVNKFDKIVNYLSNSLEDEPIELKISQSSDKSIIKLSEDAEVSLSLKINVKIPIYISDTHKILNDLFDMIKNELILVIHQQIYMNLVDYDKKLIIIPEEFYLNFFGFFIRILCFNDASKQGALSKKTLELIIRLASTFEPYSDIKISSTIKKNIKLFFSEIQVLSKKFSWEEEMLNVFKLLEKKLKL